MVWWKVPSVPPRPEGSKSDDGPAASGLFGGEDRAVTADALGDAGMDELGATFVQGGGERLDEAVVAAGVAFGGG